MLPTAALLTLNGFYLGAAFRASPALFWLLDLTQFVVVPLVSVWALQRFAGVRPHDYGLGPLVGPQDRLITLAMYALVMAVFVLGFAFTKVLALFVPWEWPASGFHYAQAIPGSPAVGLAVLVYLSLSAAFVEEIIYRGLPALCLSARVYPLVSAAAFALIHWESGTRELVATLLLGVVLGALRCTLSSNTKSLALRGRARGYRHVGLHRHLCILKQNSIGCSRPSPGITGPISRFPFR